MSSSPNIRLLSNKILVKADDAEKTSQGGIILTENSQKAVLEGTIVATGSGYYTSYSFEKPNVKEGDRIMYTQYGGQKVTLEGEDYLVMTENEIYMVLL